MMSAMFHMPSALHVGKNQTCSYNTRDQTRSKLYMCFVYVARGVESSAKPGGFHGNRALFSGNMIDFLLVHTMKN